MTLHMEILSIVIGSAHKSGSHIKRLYSI